MFKVLAGESDIRNIKNSIKVRKVIFHPKYKFSKVHDIAIIKLEEKLRFSFKVQPAKLPQNETNLSQLYIAGWGNLTNSSVERHELQSIDVSLIEHESCKKFWRDISDNFICAVGVNTVCHSFIGNPLMSGRTVHGLISFTSSCKKTLAAFIKVSNYIQFIKKHLR